MISFDLAELAERKKEKAKETKANSRLELAALAA